MNTFLLTTTLALFFLVIALLLPYFAALRRFLIALRENHQEVWERLGCPVPFSGFSPRSVSLVADYLLRKKYADLPGRVPKLGHRARNLLIAELICNAAMFSAAFASMLATGN